MESTVSGCCLQTKNGDVTATAVPNAFALLLSGPPWQWPDGWCSPATRKQKPTNAMIRKADEEAKAEGAGRAAGQACKGRKHLAGQADEEGQVNEQKTGTWKIRKR